MADEVTDPGNAVTATMIRTVVMRNGVRIDTVGKRERYVTADKGRAVIGPVRHKKRLGWRKRGQVTAAQALEGSRLVTMNDIGNQLGAISAGLAASMQKALPPLPPPQKVSRWRKAWDWWLDRYYNEAWHRGLRDCVFDITAVAIMLFTVAACVRGALWLLS
jgi:hypothetical protein